MQLSLQQGAAVPVRTQHSSHCLPLLRIRSQPGLLGPCRAYQQPGQSRPGESSSSYYPPAPSAYTPVEPSAPPLPKEYEDYLGSNSAYASATPSTSNPTFTKQAGATGYVTTLGAGISEGEEAALRDQEALRGAAGTTRTLSYLGFWSQFALSVVSAGILLFSAAFVPSVTGSKSAVEVSKWLSLVGVVAGFISALMAHGFMTLSRKLQQGGTVARGYLVNTLLTNNAISLLGIAITVIGLQASVGTLVAKSLMTAMAGPVVYSSANTGLVSLDVFSLQASTNTLLCHVVGLLYTNLMLRTVNKTAVTAKA